eukprot:jgi/Bigna1/86420/estExt_fgenesh1_pg.C_100211
MCFSSAGERPAARRYRAPQIPEGFRSPSVTPSIHPSIHPMNFFLLDLDPEKAAQMHCNRHVVKMILELTHLLWIALHMSHAPPKLKQGAKSLPLPEEVKPVLLVLTGLSKKMANLILKFVFKRPIFEAIEGVIPFSKMYMWNPLAMWVRETPANHMFTLRFAWALCREYSRRFGNKVHSCEAHLRLLEKIGYRKPSSLREYKKIRGVFSLKGCTPFPLCVPKECLVAVVSANDEKKNDGNSKFDAIQSYRAFYALKFQNWGAKGRPMRWTRKEHNSSKKRKAKTVSTRADENNIPLWLTLQIKQNAPTEKHLETQMVLPVDQGQGNYFGKKGG